MDGETGRETGHDIDGVPVTDRPCLAAFIPRPDADFRLYCFPPGGTGPEYYQNWAARLGPGVEVYAVHLPGRGSRAGRPSITDPRRLTAALADLLHGEHGEHGAGRRDERPFALFGHSIGALLAFETARALRRQGRRQPILLALSALPAPHVGSFGVSMAARVLSGAAALTDILGPIPEVRLHNPGLLATAYTPLLADLLLVLQHRHRDEAPLAVELALYGGATDPVVSFEQLAAWKDLVTSPASPHLFPGGHQYLSEQAGAVLDQLAKDLYCAHELRSCGP
ncbi:thioesterase II family protein [Wenjunlia tyrosinilytica]|uniref:Thioesterase n=1 Tax=Wenjunlia tyrosinilytica TaxID=1544741 RepID=A0A917ZTA0_9ACTN|nr:alpha/beta fold hydrolase [Wenjunlia tyrosinilytica]GGO94078.1 thioesterase [Wenjunlia tyrosinilytica]